MGLHARLQPGWRDLRKADAPANGYVQGNEIKCANGFAMQKDETCTQVIAPANAFLARNGWRCRAGFAGEGDSCVALVVPANGYVRVNNW